MYDDSEVKELMANKDGRPPVENPKQSVLGVRVTIQDHERKIGRAHV